MTIVKQGSYELSDEKVRPGLELDAKKLFYTFAVCINFMSYGMGNTMVGTSLVDLRYIYDTTEEKMSHAPLLISVGYVSGALLAGQITRWYSNRQIIMAGFLLPMALVNFAILYCSYGLMLTLLFFYGAGFGSCDTLLTVWVVELWPYHSSVLLPLSVVLLGVGQVVAPIMMSPFVHGELVPNSTVTVEERISSLFVPYTICGVFQIIIPILYVIFNFTSFRYEAQVAKIDEENSVDEEIQKVDPRISENPFRMYHLGIAGIAVAGYGGCEHGWNAFAPTMFQHLNGKDFIDASEASLLLAYFSIAFSVGLLLTTFVSMKLTPDTIIFSQLALIFVALFMILFGYTNKTIIYVAVILLGYGMSPLWSMKFAFIEKHLKLSDGITSLYTVMFGCFAILVPLILEQTAKSNPRMLVIIMIVFMSMSALSFVTVKTWLEILRRKRQSKKTLSKL